MRVPSAPPHRPTRRSEETCGSVEADAAPTHSVGPAGLADPTHRTWATGLVTNYERELRSGFRSNSRTGSPTNARAAPPRLRRRWPGCPAPQRASQPFAAWVTTLPTFNSATWPACGGQRCGSNPSGSSGTAASLGYVKSQLVALAPHTHPTSGRTRTTRIAMHLDRPRSGRCPHCS